MKNTTSLYGLCLVLALIALSGCASSPQLSQEQALSQYPQLSSLNSALNDSRENYAEFLAPKSFSEALDLRESAMKAAQKDDADGVNEATTEGLNAIDKVNSNIENSEKILGEVLSARKRAIAAGASSTQAKKLAELDDDFKKTSTMVEDGKIEKAKQQRPELLEGYNKLELVALKQGMSDQAKAAIANAKEQGAEKYAPKTLAQAEAEMALAAKILDSDRTMTDKAEVHAKNAKWMAERSAVITEIIKDVDRRDYSREDMVLWHQAQLSTINEPLGGQLPFNESGNKAVLSIKNAIIELKAAEDKYEKELASTEKERLAMQEKERANKQKFEKVQAMFSATEANVYLKRQNVLISAHGFQYPSGKSEIQTENFPLANKIIQAIRIFPEARIEITGHTDSTGSEETNLSLSQDRAEKLGKFLSEVGEISPDRIKTSGYGESRPVASNKTEEGRAENRRVEINIINE